MTQESPAERPTLSATVNKLAHMIAQTLPPGDVAGLRRMRPHDTSAGVFWRLVATELATTLPESESARQEEERRWAVILQAMAAMRGWHAPGARLGQALATAGIAEQRVLKLLRASGGVLFDGVRITTHHLATTGTPADHYEIARLVLSDGRGDEENVRRRIARDYYARLARQEAR